MVAGWAVFFAAAFAVCLGVNGGLACRTGAGGGSVTACAAQTELAQTDPIQIDPERSSTGKIANTEFNEGVQIDR